MKIYLVRHGESTSDIKQRYDGDYDDHLTDNGFNQAHVLGDKLLNKKINQIFTSSRIRALETATIIGTHLECPIITDNGLQEQDIYNAYKYLSLDQPEEEYRRLGEIAITRDNAQPGTEAYEDFSERVLHSFDLIANTSHTCIVIVTHGGPIRCIFRERVKAGEIRKINNGAIIELEKTNTGFSFVSMDGVVVVA